MKYIHLWNWHNPLVLFIIFLSIKPSLCFSTSIPNTPFEYTEWINSKLLQLKDLTPKEYPLRIDHFRELVEKYIDHKKRVCNGDFSTFVLDKTQKIKNKLTREEKKLCFKELKAFQITTINHMYFARKKYLLYIHNLRLKELSTLRNSLLNKLREN